MSDTQPKPTAAEVLAVHWDVCGDGSLCDCGWQRPLRPGAATPGRSMHLQHQEDMLAAAGLLVSAEHNAQVLRDAALAWQTGSWADDLPKGGSRAALILGMAQRATDWLRARADRIAAGGES